jgi:hypothetical protein
MVGMNTAQFTILVLEASALLLLLLLLSFFLHEKLKGIEKRAIFPVDPHDARVLHQSLMREIGMYRQRKLGIAVLTALLSAFAFCVSYLDVSRTNNGISLVFLLLFSSFVFFTGVFMILSAMYRLRESRIMLHKFLYRHVNASRKTVYINLLRQSLYYLDKKAFKIRRRSDFSMKPELSTVFILISLASIQAFTIVSFIDLLAPM